MKESIIYAVEGFQHTPSLTNLMSEELNFNFQPKESHYSKLNVQESRFWETSTPIQHTQSQPPPQLSLINSIIRPPSVDLMVQVEKLKENKISVEPLNTERLLPTRHKTKKAVMTILPSGEVVIEFLKSGYGEEKITDVCRITGDGLRVVLYRPENGR